MEIKKMEKVVDWCNANYGLKGGVPSICFRKDIEMSNDGFYIEEDNTITVKVDTDREMIKTIIHEWQHYLQSKDQFEMLYNMGYSYEDHPFEVVANAISNRDWKECFDKVD